MNSTLQSMTEQEGLLSYHRDLFVSVLIASGITVGFLTASCRCTPNLCLSGGAAGGYAEAVFVGALATTAAVLGVVLAGVAIVVAFVNPEDFSTMYSANRAAYERYVAVFFAPARLAVITVPVAIVCRAMAYLIPSSPPAIVLATAPELFVLCYQLTSLWETVSQVEGALGSVAKIPEPRASGHGRGPER